MLVIPFRSLTGSYGDLFTGDWMERHCEKKEKRMHFLRKLRVVPLTSKLNLLASTAPLGVTSEFVQDIIIED